MIEIEFENSEKLFIDKHKSILEYKDFMLLLWGGRFGAKSETIARKLVIECLSFPYFRCVLGRKVFNTIEDSQYQTIKDFVFENGLESFFTFKKAPLRIDCANGNSFICRGFDKPEKIKSIKNPSHFWIEELSECEINDFETAITTLRGLNDTQFIGTFNPETEIELSEFWLFNKFFKDRIEDDFEDVYKIKIEDKIIELNVRSIHTTYKDNPYLNDKQRALIEKYKQDYETTKSQTAAYYYLVWTLGKWGNKLPENRYLYAFTEMSHVNRFMYNSELVLHISIDKNVNPYLPASIWQVENQKNFKQISEIVLLHPFNRTRELARQIVQYCRNHSYNTRVMIYGDATAKHDDTNQELGTNFFTIIKSELEKEGLSCELRVPGMRTNKVLDAKRKHKNPNSLNAAEFINDILSKKIKEFSIEINENCKTSINDYINVKKDKDGNIDKSEKDIKTNGQKYGHLTDAFKYFICEYLYDEFESYCNFKKKYL